MKKAIAGTQSIISKEERKRGSFFVLLFSGHISRVAHSFCGQPTSLLSAEENWLKTAKQIQEAATHASCFMLNLI